MACRGCSLPLARAASSFGSEFAYRKASEQLLEHYGLEVPASRARACCMRLGERLAACERREPVGKLPAAGAEAVVLEADGTMVPVILEQRPGGDRRKGKRLGYKEMRLLAACQQGSATPVYAAGFYSCEQAGAAWSRCCLEAGWSMGTTTHTVADGAEWIRLQHGIHFSRFGRLLIDCYHACEYLAAAFEDKRSFERHKALMLEERIDGTLLELAEMAEEETGEDDPATAALRYLNNRYEHLFYQQARQQDLPIGSGMIESGHRHVLHARLKLPGCWWLPENANRMAKIRAAKANGQWDELWQTQKAA